MDYSIKTLSQLRPILQGFRKTAGLTQAAMASHLGVTQQTYAQLEANPAAVSVERLFKVLRVLQVDLKLTQSGGESAESAAAENTASVPAATPVTARTTSARPAKKASAAATGDVKRKTPSTRQQTTSAATPARIKSPAKPGARTNTREVGGNTASEARRAAANARRVSKKREDW
ncbi:transcriptional regulator [Burkholderia sp. SG-MS1]|uniref:helix-turn-helix domain-containing protein n=1 Tax=Paraburkholderia sp. SG-MS1 TaxID=2023741 RepID=UPI0014454886|nr:transcriptional regulator [Paraburkholderia sp. SG-MS1]